MVWNTCFLVSSWGVWKAYFSRGSTVSFQGVWDFWDVGYVGMDFSPMLDVETTRGFEVPRGGQMWLRLVEVFFSGAVFVGIWVYSPDNWHVPWKSMVGRCISYWNSPLNREHVSFRGCRGFFSLSSCLVCGTWGCLCLALTGSSTEVSMEQESITGFEGTKTSILLPSYIGIIINHFKDPY